MRVAEVMTRDVVSIAPDASLREAARRMDELNVGVLPVADKGRLVGILTDRDVTVRATAAGAAPDRTLVADVMTEDVRWCEPEDDVEVVTRLMADMQVRRVPVLDTSGMLVGIVALGDLAEDEAPGTTETLREISTPSEPDRPSGRAAEPAEPSRPETPARPNDDVQEDIEEKLDGETTFDFESVDAEVSDGEVHLVGTVESFPAKRRAVALAFTVPGVRSVVDGLRIRRS